MVQWLSFRLGILGWLVRDSPEELCCVLEQDFNPLLNNVSTKKDVENVLTLTENLKYQHKGVQWLSGRVLDSRPKGRRFELHCVVVLEQDTFILA